LPVPGHANGSYEGELDDRSSQGRVTGRDEAQLNSQVKAVGVLGEIFDERTEQVFVDLAVNSPFDRPVLPQCLLIKPRGLWITSNGINRTPRMAMSTEFPSNIHYYCCTMTGP
jgi:hypothetical protein